MSKLSSAAMADMVFNQLQAGAAVETVKQGLVIDASTWGRVSCLVYEKAKQVARKEREIEGAKRPHAADRFKSEVTDLLALNQLLASYALLAPPTITVAEFRRIEQLAAALPSSEKAILTYIGNIIMTPKMCAILRQGVAGFPAFEPFLPLVEAAILAYYQENYISSFLTLVPVVEGILLRWYGFDGTGPDPKPQFEDIRKFVGNSYLRQPDPGNVLFHEVYVQASQALLADHLYRNSTAGQAYANFNRHLAAHLLSNDLFATQDNCLRLFMLLDALLKVYVYEIKTARDPRFDVDEPMLRQDVLRYQLVLMQQQLFKSLP